MKKRKNKIKFHISGIKRWLFKSKFNFFVILLSIIGVALGTYLFGFLFPIEANNAVRIAPLIELPGRSGIRVCRSRMIGESIAPTEFPAPT